MQDHRRGPGRGFPQRPAPERSGPGGLRETKKTRYPFVRRIPRILSGAYHTTTTGGAARAVMLRLDHAAIFVLIACTFTPVHVILFRGVGRWGSLLLIWGFAVVAITCKSIYFYTMPEWLGLSLYLGMGWIGLASGFALYRQYGFAFVAPVLWGGLAYSIGAVLDHLKWPEPIPGAVRSHEVFHIAVLIGLAFHWSFIYSIADGRLSPIQTEL